MTTTRPRAAIRILLILNLILCTFAVSTPAQASLPRCAWPLKVGADDNNIAFPDTAAVYWSTQYLVTSDLEIKVDGFYPDARYASLNVYDSTTSSFTSDGVGSNLPDYQIAPLPGSINPWNTAGAAGGAFSVTLRMAPGGEPNVLPLAPSGTADGTKGSLIFRVYLPKGNAFGRVRLPTLTATQGGVTTTLPTCAAAVAPAAVATGSSALKAAGDPLFTRMVLDGAAPNADNAYLGVWIPAPAAGDVVVIRGKAPSAVSGNGPSVWPDRRHNLRYFSMCSNLAEPNGPVVSNPLGDGTVDYGCRYDDNTVLDRGGYYNYVLGTEAQRATIEAIAGATFLPLSSSQPTAPHLLLLRNLLPADSFTKAVQNVPVGSTPAEAAAIMGSYYPQLSTTVLATPALVQEAGLPDTTG